MPTYTCKRCNYSTNIRNHLLNHYNRKRICVAKDKDSDVSIETLITEFHANQEKTRSHLCDQCHKRFASLGSLNRHLKSCDIGPFNFDILVKELKDIKTQIYNLKSQSPSVTYNTQNVNNHIIVNFGHERLDHITNEFLTHCLLEMGNGVNRLIDKIHFDNDVPENMNIRLKSRKSKTLEKYTHDGWISCDANNTLDELFTKGYRILFQHFYNVKENHDRVKVNESTLQNWFLQMMDRKTNAYYKIRRDLYMLICNNALFVVQGNPST